MTRSSNAKLAAFALGAGLAATAEAGAALLLYTGRGFLSTAGFLIALSLGGLSLGLWVDAEGGRPRRRWTGLVIMYLAGGALCVWWSKDATLTHSPFGGALAAFFLLAGPAYATTAVFQTFARHDRDTGPAAFLGAAFGILAAARILIPNVPPSVIFIAIAAVLIVVALIQPRGASHQMATAGISLNGKRAVVTGVGDRGQLGYVLAQRLQSAGAQVCITALHADVVELARELGVVGVQCDLTNDDDVARLITTADQRLGGIDILVNVAGGLSVIKPLAETSRAEWERETQRNAETAFLVSRAALPKLREGRGAIINFASPAGLRAVPQLGAYSAAKAAVVALTRTLAIEEKTNGVRVNALAPGMIDTEHNRKSVADPATVKWVTREQIADVVVFLASDAASAITGETIHVLGEGVE